MRSQSVQFRNLKEGKMYQYSAIHNGNVSDFYIDSIHVKRLIKINLFGWRLSIKIPVKMKTDSKNW